MPGRREFPKRATLSAAGFAVAGCGWDGGPQYFISPMMPRVDHAAWRLDVSGMVRRPHSLSLSDPAGMPRVTLRLRHYCIEGWTSVATWTGVRLAEIARAIGLNGSWLTPATARLYSNVKYGYKSVKYLTDIRFVPESTGGYWEDRGYDWYAGL